MLPNELPSASDPRHPVHCVHQVPTANRALTDVSPACDDRVFGDLMSGLVQTVCFDDMSFSERDGATVMANLSANRCNGIDVDEFARHIGAGREAALRTLKTTTQRSRRESPFSIGGRRLRSIHDRLHRRRLKERFCSDTACSQTKSTHGDTCFQVFATPCHFIDVQPMKSDTGDSLGEALTHFTQNIGVPDEMVTDGHKSMIGPGTAWRKQCARKDIKPLQTEPHSHWQNLSEGGIRELKRTHERIRVAKRVP